MHIDIENCTLINSSRSCLLVRASNAFRGCRFQSERLWTGLICVPALLFSCAGMCPRIGMKSLYVWKLEEQQDCLLHTLLSLFAQFQDASTYVEGSDGVHLL